MQEASPTGHGHTAHSGTLGWGCRILEDAGRTGSRALPTPQRSSTFSLALGSDWDTWRREAKVVQGNPSFWVWVCILKAV